MLARNVYGLRAWWSCLYGVLVFMLMAWVAPGPAAAGPFIRGPLVRISGASPFGPLESCGNFPGPDGQVFLDSEVEPWVDVNPTDANNVVAFWQQDRWSNGGARSNVAGVSLDGGATWQTVIVPGLTDCSGGNFQRASDPWISFGPDGTLHQISLVLDIDTPPGAPGGFGRNGLAVSKSEDGGLTWSEPILIIEDADPRILNDKESLTADPTDENFVYAAWDRLQLTEAAVKITPENLAPGRGLGIGLGFKSPFYFARSTDGGATWEAPRQIYDPGANNQTIGHQIVVRPDGTVIDFFTEILNFRNDPGMFTFHLSLLRSPNKGETWLPRGRPIRTNAIRARGVVTPDGQEPVRDAAILFDVAVDPDSGALHAVWQDARFDGVDAIAYAQSTDGGSSWSMPVKINQTPISANPLRQQAFIPSVAVGQSGTVLVTYYDFRNDIDGAAEERADHFAIHCESACTSAASWGNELRLTDVSFDITEAPVARGLFLGDYVGLASDGVDGLPVFSAPHSGDPASLFFRRFGPLM